MNDRAICERLRTLVEIDGPNYKWRNAELISRAWPLLLDVVGVAEHVTRQLGSQRPEIAALEQALAALEAVNDA